MPPSITATSGEWSHSNSVTISGSGFGSKSPATPTKWDNFEAGSVGSLVAGTTPIYGSAWGDLFIDANARPKFSDTKLRHSLSTRSARHDYVTGTNYNSSIEHLGTHAVLYMTFWWNWQRQPSTPYARGMKPWQEFGTVSDEPGAYIGFGNPDLADGAVRNAVIDSGTSADTTMFGNIALQNIENEWIRHEVYLMQSSPNLFNGQFSYWIHRPNAGTPVIALQGSDTTYRTRTSSGTWNQWTIGAYHARDDPATAAAYIYSDDVYLDVTQARVEVGNASTWATCTKREIQIPTAWVDGSITVMVNRASYGAADAAWLYVVDSSGVNSAGFAITFGTNQGAAPPTLPVKTSRVMVIG